MNPPYNSKISKIECNDFSLPIKLDKEFGLMDVKDEIKDLEFIEGDI